MVPSAGKALRAISLGGCPFIDVIPVKVLEDFEDLQDILAWARKEKGFDFNGNSNGIMLPKKNNANNVSGHSRHDPYNTAVKSKLKEKLEGVDDMEKKFRIVQDFIKDTNKILEIDVLLGGMDVKNVVNL